EGFSNALPNSPPLRTNLQDRPADNHLGPARRSARPQGLVQKCRGAAGRAVVAGGRVDPAPAELPVEANHKPRPCPASEWGRPTPFAGEGFPPPPAQHFRRDPDETAAAA